MSTQKLWLQLRGPAAHCGADSFPVMLGNGAELLTQTLLVSWLGWEVAEHSSASLVQDFLALCPHPFLLEEQSVPWRHPLLVPHEQPPFLHSHPAVP